MQLNWTYAARKAVYEIVDYISEDSIIAAEKWENAIFRTTDKLINFPRIGRRVPEFDRDDIREILYGNYRIIYHLKADKIDILTVWHGKRLLKPSILPPNL